MNVRRRRALLSALGALFVAVLCAVLSSNVHGGHRTFLLVLTVAWLVIAASCVVNALRTARPAEAPSLPDDATVASEPGTSTGPADDQA